MAGSIAEKILDAQGWLVDSAVTRYLCVVKTATGVKVADTEGADVEGIAAHDQPTVGAQLSVNRLGMMAAVSGAAISGGAAGVFVMTNNTGKLIPYVVASGKVKAGICYTTTTGADQLVQFWPTPGGIV